MNEKKLISILENFILLDSYNERGIGKSTELINIANKLNAIFITAHNQKYSEANKQEFWESHNLIGCSETIIFDHLTLRFIFQECINHLFKDYSKPKLAEIIAKQDTRNALYILANKIEKLEEENDKNLTCLWELDKAIKKLEKIDIKEEINVLVKKIEKLEDSLKKRIIILEEHKTFQVSENQAILKRQEKFEAVLLTIIHDKYDRCSNEERELFYSNLMKQLSDSESYEVEEEAKLELEQYIKDLPRKEDSGKSISEKVKRACPEYTGCLGTHQDGTCILDSKYGKCKPEEASGKCEQHEYRENICINCGIPEITDPKEETSHTECFDEVVKAVCINCQADMFIYNKNQTICLECFLHDVFDDLKNNRITLQEGKDYLVKDIKNLLNEPHRGGAEK